MDLASFEGDSECVKLLLHSKAVPKVKDEKGKIPSRLTFKDSRSDCVKLLVYSKAYQNWKFEYGWILKCF